MNKSAITPEKKMPLKRSLMDMIQKRGIPIIVAFVAMSIVLMIIAHIFTEKAVTNGVSSLGQSYQTAMDTAYQNTFESYENMAYEIAEANHHVSNRINIDITGLRETNKLEVLRVTDVEYIIEDQEDNSYDITAWLEVSGHGVYTIDMQNSAYAINSEKNQVKIRLPKPQLTEIKVDDFKKLLFQNQIIHNETPREGEELADKQLKEAEARIRDEFISNPNNLRAAKSSAEFLIKSQIQALNPDDPDLNIKIEFESE